MQKTNPSKFRSTPISEIKVDTASIPDYVRDSIAEITLKCVREYLQQPGGRERLDALIKADKAKKAAAKAVNKQAQN